MTLISNIFYFLISTLTIKLIGYILLPIFTSNMTTAEYGTADVLMSTVNLFYPISAMGLSGAVMRYALVEKHNIAITFTSAIKLLLLSSLLSLGMIPFLQSFSTTSAYAYFVPLLMFLNNLMGLFSSLCKGIDKTKLIVLQNLGYSIFLLGSAILLVKIRGLGVKGYLFSYSGACVISLIILIFGSRAYQYINFGKTKQTYYPYYKKLLSYGMPLVPNSLAWWITQMSDRYMVAYWYGAAANGLYAVAYKIPSVINAFVSIFMQAWQLTAIGEYKKKDSIEFYNFVYRQYCVICYLFSSIVLICTQILAKILFANEFYLAWKYVPLLLVAAAVGSQEEYMGTYYLADNRTNKYFISSVIGAGINILMNLTLIPFFSVWGATSATLISYLIVFFQRAIDMRKKLGVDILILKNITSIFILTIQAITFVLLDSYRYLCSILCIFALMALFFPEIMQMLKIIKDKILSRH